MHTRQEDPAQHRQDSNVHMQQPPAAQQKMIGSARTARIIVTSQSHSASVATSSRAAEMTNSINAMRTSHQRMINTASKELHGNYLLDLLAQPQDTA